MATGRVERPILSGRSSVFQRVKWPNLGKILDALEVVLASSDGRDTSRALTPLKRTDLPLALQRRLRFEEYIQPPRVEAECAKTSQPWSAGTSACQISFPRLAVAKSSDPGTFRKSRLQGLVTSGASFRQSVPMTVYR